MRILLLLVFLLSCTSTPKLIVDENPVIPKEENLEVVKVSGNIFDAGSKEGIEGALLKVTNTTISALSDEDGEFLLSGLEEGLYTITVFAPGYIDKTENLKVYKGSILFGNTEYTEVIKIPLVSFPDVKKNAVEFFEDELNLLLKRSARVSLKIDSLALARQNLNRLISNEIDSSMSVKREDKFFKHFRDVFITSDPKRCNAITWPDNAFKEIREGLPEMQLKEPISFKVFNYETGYIIEVFLKDFKSIDDGLGVRFLYDADFYFEPLNIVNKELVSSWEKKRDDLYTGSLRFFLKKLIAGKHKSESFRTYGGQYSQANEASLGSSVIFSGDIELKKEEFFGFDAITGNYYLEYPGEIKVEYQDRFMGRGYKYQGLNELRYETSWIKIKGKRAYFTENGQFLDPGLVDLNGFWGFKKICDQIPLNY